MTSRNIKQKQPPKQESVSSTLVLNALSDLVLDEEDHVEEVESRRLLKDIYEEATTAAERSAFTDALRKIQTDIADIRTRNTEIVEEEIGPVLGAVVQELRDEGVQTILNHEAILSVPPREAALYSFFVQQNSEVLSTLQLTGTVKHAIERGATAVAEGEYDDAADAFEEAVCSPSELMSEDHIVAHTLAALGHHWNGDDEQAQDRLAEVRDRNSALTANLLKVVVDHDSPEKFRNGELASRIYLRGNIDVPDGCSVMAYRGTGRDGSDEWVELGDCLTCSPLSALESETRIRLSFAGVLPSFPTVYGYYLTYGIVDLDDSHAMSSEEVLLSGPIHDSCTETIKCVRMTN